jgi:hypothetical protein
MSRHLPPLSSKASVEVWVGKVARLKENTKAPRSGTSLPDLSSRAPVRSSPIFSKKSSVHQDNIGNPLSIVGMVCSPVEYKVFCREPCAFGFGHVHARHPCHWKHPVFNRRRDGLDGPRQRSKSSRNAYHARVASTLCQQF